MKCRTAGVRTDARKLGAMSMALLVLMLSWTVTSTSVHAADSQPPDVVVLCEPTLEQAVSDLGASFRRQTGVPVHVLTSPTWAILEQISHRLSGDLVIGEGDTTASAAIQRELIRPETLRHLWRNQLVVAAIAESSGAAAPHLAAIAGKAAIAMTDPTTAVAGIEGMQALETLGLWDAVKAKSIGVVDTADAAYLLAQGNVHLAILYATDVAANASFVISDRFPSGSYDPIVYWVAQTREAASANTEKFADFLRQPQSQQEAQRDGLEVVP